MKYALLIYDDQESWGKLDEQTRAGIYEEYGKFYSTMEEKGQMRGGQELQPTTTATTVRIRDGKTLTTDGPFAETKEQLGGYYMVECENLDRRSRRPRIPSANAAARSRSGRPRRTSAARVVRSEVVDRLFRQESGRAVATLVRALGDFDLAEEAVQEAFAVALDRWKAHGVPDNPGAWITARPATARSTGSAGEKRLSEKVRRSSSKRQRARGDDAEEDGLYPG